MSQDISCFDSSIRRQRVQLADSVRRSGVSLGKLERRRDCRSGGADRRGQALSHLALELGPKSLDLIRVDRENEKKVAVVATRPHYSEATEDITTPRHQEGEH